MLQPAFSGTCISEATEEMRLLDLGHLARARFGQRPSSLLRNLWIDTYVGVSSYLWSLFGDSKRNRKTTGEPYFEITLLLPENPSLIAS